MFPLNYLGFFLVADVTRYSHRSLSRITQFIGPEILKGSVPDVEDPNHLTLLIDFVENPIGSVPLSEKETPDLPLCFFGFTG